MIDVGIVGVGTYLPEKTMKAAEIARLTNGVWSEDAVINKLGIKQRYLPGPDDGTQEMGAKAALKCLENTGVDPKEIDVILCIGEEWKEYPLTTSACYIQDRIGATNAWGIDVQNRCCTCVSAMKIAADMLRADDEINTIMICGGYRNGDFVDFTDKDMSMMYNLSAGGGAIILKKNYGKNLLLGSKIMSDGSLARTAGVEKGIISRSTADSYLISAYAMSSFIALDVFMTGIDRLADKEITREAFLEAMESAPINVPISGGVNYANGQRIGLDGMSFVKYVRPTEAGAAASTGTFVNVVGMQSIDQILGELDDAE